MIWWLIGTVGSGLAGAGVTVLVTVLHRRRHRRAGGVTGNWWQVTYPGGDLDMENEPWSIELVRADDDGEEVVGSFWRVYAYTDPPCYERHWSFVGRGSSDSLDLLYWDRSKAGGGDGSVHLWRLNNCLYRGKFVHTKKQFKGLSIVFEFEECPIEWVRVDTPEAHRVTRWLRNVPPDTSFLPRKPKRLVSRIVDQLLANAPYAACAAGENFPALVREAEQRGNDVQPS